MEHVPPPSPAMLAAYTFVCIHVPSEGQRSVGNGTHACTCRKTVAPLMHGNMYSIFTCMRGATVFPHHRAWWLQSGSSGRAKCAAALVVPLYMYVQCTCTCIVVCTCTVYMYMYTWTWTRTLYRCFCAPSRVYVHTHTHTHTHPDMCSDW